LIYAIGQSVILCVCMSSEIVNVHHEQVLQVSFQLTSQLVICRMRTDSGKS